MSIPRYEDMKQLFSSESAALEWVAGRCSARRYNSSFDATQSSPKNKGKLKNKSLGKRTKTFIPTEVNAMNVSTVAVDDDVPINISEATVDASIDPSQGLSILDCPESESLNGSALGSPTHELTPEEMQQKLDSIQAVQEQLLARSKLPCHTLLLISHLWLAKCSAESIALVSGCAKKAVSEWLHVCLQSILEIVQDDVKVLPRNEQILIAERIWRRKNEDKLWNALMDAVFKPVYDSIELDSTAVDEVKEVMNEVEEEGSLIAKFEAMGLKDELVDGIVAAGISEPIEVRQRVIMPIMGGKDVIVQAPDGIDRRMALCIGMLQQIDTSKQECQTILVCPTKEHAKELQDLIFLLGKVMNVTAHCCIGGSALRDDIKSLSDGVHIVLGTLSRITDMIQRKYLLPENLHVLVMDDTEEIFARNGSNHLERFFGFFGLEQIQTIIFSNHYSNEALETLKKTMQSPLFVEIKREQLSLKNVKHFLITLHSLQEKWYMLKDFWNIVQSMKCVIYCNTCKKAEWLVNLFHEEDIPAVCVHSETPRKQRDVALDAFRATNSSNGEISASVLITTDIRGIHFQTVPLVINFDIPPSRELYLKRGGRYYGHKAIIINLIQPNEARHMRDIQHYHGVRVSDIVQNSFTELALEIFKIT